MVSCKGGGKTHAEHGTINSCVCTVGFRVQIQGPSRAENFGNQQEQALEPHDHVPREGMGTARTSAEDCCRLLPSSTVEELQSQEMFRRALDHYRSNVLKHSAIESGTFEFNGLSRPMRPCLIMSLGSR